MQTITTTITYENEDLVSSGSLITIGPGETAIDLYVEKDHLRIIVQFSGEDTDTSKQSVEALAADDETLKLHFVNYNNRRGTHRKEPLELGTIAGRNVRLAYRIVALQLTMSKHFTYSFYIGRKVTDG